MKKIMKIVSIMMISFLVLNISLLKVNAEENNKVIVIDPGHGGIDGGAKSENGVIEKDINLSISLKTKAALESKGYFISIHQNMFPQKNCKGAQVWSANNEPSQKLGKIIQQKFKEEVDQNNKREAKVAKKEYKILNDGYEGASVIVECGFLSNPEECELLGKEDYQNKIANTLANAIDEYFK